VKKVQIEARVVGDLATTYILPAAIKYQNVLISNIKGLKDIGINESGYVNQKHIATKISEHISNISSDVEAMIEARKVANEISDSRDKAIAYCDKVKPFFDKIRYHVDKLELLVDDEYWELPKYREMLFLR
jgi:glutamine synthetase